MSSIVSDAFRYELRESTGGGASRALRRTGMIPAELYGDKKENVHLSLDPRDVMKGLESANFYSTVFELDIKGKKERVLVRDVQMHPVKDTPLHVDFLRVAKGAKIHVNVPIVLKNEKNCPGLKTGGVLNIVLHSLDVTCAVDAIPENIVVDLAGLEIGTSVHANSLDLGKGVTLTHPERDETVVTLIAPSGPKKTTEEESTEE